MRRLKQGTISFFFGCHDPVHSILVVLSWRKLYGEWPRLWQIACIFLHDIGHIGVDYLDSYDDKKRHWELGAMAARHLFGWEGWRFLAGHSKHSNTPLSKLYKADKFSWSMAPTWWLWKNNVVEPKLKGGMGNLQAIRDFRAKVKENIESGRFGETHEIYLGRVDREAGETCRVEDRKESVA